jgi:hypothetical protein
MTAKTILMQAQAPTEAVYAREFSYKSIYRVGGLAALVAVMIALLDIFMMFLPGTSVSGPGTRTVVDWFILYKANPFLALRDLGLFNMVTTSCTVLAFFAIYIAHKQVNQAYAALALILICIGTTIYIANNTAFSMLTLSSQYAAAATESQKTLLAAAGQTLLAQEDISPGSFMGFFIPEIAGILMSVVMLRSRIFSRWTAWAGILGETFLLIFNIFAAFVPALFDTAILLSIIGGLLSMLWLTLIARRLFQLGS